VITASDLIYPVFIQEGQNQRTAVGSLPGVERLSVDLLLPVAEELRGIGHSGYWRCFPSSTRR